MMKQLHHWLQVVQTFISPCYHWQKEACAYLYVHASINFSILFHVAVVCNHFLFLPNCFSSMTKGATVLHLKTLRNTGLCQCPADCLINKQLKLLTTYYRAIWMGSMVLWLAQINSISYIWWFASFWHQKIHTVKLCGGNYFFFPSALSDGITLKRRRGLYRLFHSRHFAPALHACLLLLNSSGICGLLLGSTGVWHSANSW